MPAAPVSDFRWYYDRAVGLANGIGYLGVDGLPTAYLPVGYPGFLAAVFQIAGPSVMTGKLANAILGAMTVPLCFLLFDRILVSSPERKRKSLRLGIIMMAVFPSQVAYASLISDSILFQFLLLSGMLLFCTTARWGVVLGAVFIGLATLTRPYALGIPLLLAAFCGSTIARKELRTRLLVTMVVALGVLVPWTARNARVLGGLVPVSTNAGINLLIGNGPGANGGFTEIPLERVRALGLPEVDADRLAMRIALRAIWSDPVRIVKLIPMKVYHLYADDAQALRWNLKGVRGVDSVRSYSPIDYAGMLCLQIPYLLVWVGSLGWLVSKWRKGVLGLRPELVGFGFILYVGFVGVVSFGNPRYHYPVIPFLCLYSADWVTGLRSGRADRSM